MSALSIIHDALNNVTGIANADYTDALMNADLTLAAKNLLWEMVEAWLDWKITGDTALANIVASSDISKRYYAFPTAFLKLKSVYIKADGTNWRKCTWVDLAEVGDHLGREEDVVANFNNDEPFYAIEGNKIIFLSGTLAALANGIRYYFSEIIVGRTSAAGVDMTTFVGGADADIPIIPEPFEMALIWLAAKIKFQASEMTERVKEMNRELYGNPNGRPADPRQIGGIVGALRGFTVTEEQMMIKPSSSLEKYE